MIDDEEMRENVPYLLRAILGELQEIRKALNVPPVMPTEEEIAEAARISYQAAAKAADEARLARLLAQSRALVDEVKQ